ncbi:hypothetical protein EYR36_003341 [Pleurotus pulmonarius]|nr:hypothetical protein EYR36_003341 [Pleurotus pulmonarius]
MSYESLLPLKPSTHFHHSRTSVRPTKRKERYVPIERVLQCLWILRDYERLLHDATTEPLVAYYAGFGDRRPCGINIAPDDIDWSPYTHVHFAFATITQGLQIQLDDADAPLLRRLVAQKVNHPQLKVVIAVGGWDFSESQPTRDLFSLMISSASNRNTFIASVTSFLSQFGVDGIDIDFEYPGAMERNAPATDTPNLTAFFKDLRTALPTQVISCAAPAGYWFLQGFEINKITSSVSYINMMSYDYHGQWDTNVADQDPVTNPHTSILDMRDSALLYVRAGIDLSMVNLGLAFYARTYQLANSGCKGYGCTMVGGGAPGPCSASAGILTQFEVDALLQSGITPTLDASSKTYWLDNQGSLVTFDQSDTWAAKAQFAGSTCFGGTFIWSLDQTTSGVRDYEALGSRDVLNLMSPSLPLVAAYHPTLPDNPL